MVTRFNISNTLESSEQTDERSFSFHG